MRSPPQPNPGLPGFGHLKTCRKRASPQPAGEGLGVGVVRFFRRSRHHYLAAPPPPHPSPTRGEGADRVCGAASLWIDVLAHRMPAAMNFSTLIGSPLPVGSRGSTPPHRPPPPHPSPPPP